MDFGVLDGLMSSENKNSLTSSCDLDVKTKWYGSEAGFCKQERTVSATREDEWRDLKMAKISDDDISKTMLLQQQQQQNRSNGGQSMLSFSSPNTQSSVTFPYYARNNIVAAGYGAAGPFTPSQWMELEHQALIYKYITANAAIPSNLLIPIRKALETAAFCSYSGRQNTYGWGTLHLGFCNGSDPEPGRCRRTDGKKWRCAKDAVPDQKYCERHMNRGRHRSRKPVESQNCNNNTGGATKITTNTSVLRRSATPNPAASLKDNRNSMAVPLLHSSSIALKKNDHSTPEENSNITEFGLVCSDSLLNPMYKSDSKSHNSLHQFMEEWPHSSQVSTTNERLDLSPLRMGLGMSNQVNRVPGGPLGEVLQHSTSNSPTSLDTMTEQMGPMISHKMQLGYLL